MVKVGMDTDSPGNVGTLRRLLGPPAKFTFQHAGYDANPIFNVTGFSQLHDDGA